MILNIWCSTVNNAADLPAVVAEAKASVAN